MKRLSIPLLVTVTLLAILLLAACAPGEPAPSAEEIQAAINTAVAQTVEAEGKIATSVAMTVAARETEAADALPTTVQSATPLPTLTPVLATATSFVVAPSGGGGGGGGGGGSISGDHCDIIHQRPQDNTEYRRAHTFDVSFTILNNGTTTWAAGKDLVLQPNGNPGPTLTTPPVAPIQLPEMKPGDTFAVGPFDAAAPDDPGLYVIDFKLEGGFCYPYVAFYVVR